MKPGVIAFLLMAGAAQAQTAKPPVESVTVTAERAREEQIRSFVQSFVAPTRMTGKFARWEDRICPVTVGLKPAAAKFITARVKDVAARAGVGINDSERCRANVAIVFSKNPQALLDDIRSRRPELLGYYDNEAQRDALAAVSHPIQAWYVTATKDLRGNPEVDNAKGGGAEFTIQDSSLPNTFMTLSMPNAHFRNVTGSRLGDGLRSVFVQIVIVADPAKLADHEIGALADYISMLSLTQLNALDTCRQLPSIVNLLAPGCDRAANALTQNDLAYLRGLYKMSLDQNLRVQQDQIAWQMEQSLKGK